MVSPVSVETLASDIKAIYKADPLRAETLIEAYIKQTLQEFSTTEKVNVLEKLTHQFESFCPEVLPEIDLESKEFLRLFSIIFGERISPPDLCSKELLEKLVRSLNTIFNTLNQIVGLIQNTLFGKKTEFEETIRHVIGSDLERSAEATSLQSYLDQIQEAFLVAHQAFKKAAQTKVDDILKELDPDHIEASTISGLKFGPFRKAEFFEIYKEKFRVCKGWFESGRFTEELLREFEKTCQKIYERERRERNGKIY